MNIWILLIFIEHRNSTHSISRMILLMIRYIYVNEQRRKTKKNKNQQNGMYGYVSEQKFERARARGLRSRLRRHDNRLQPEKKKTIENDHVVLFITSFRFHIHSISSYSFFGFDFRVVYDDFGFWHVRQTANMIACGIPFGGNNMIGASAFVLRTSQSHITCHTRHIHTHIHSVWNVMPALGNHRWFV